MENMSLGSLIIFIIIAAVAGYLFGIFDSKVTSSLKKGIEEGEKEKQERLGEVTALGLQVDAAQNMHVDLDGARIKPETISPEQRRRMIQLINILRPYIEGGQIAPAPKPEPIRSSASPAVIVIPEVREPPRIDPLKGMRLALESSVSLKEEEKPSGIIALIDQVLQRKLAGTAFAGREIKLEAGDVGEVIVCIGMNKYKGIDAVPDETIKQIIKDAIAEWNK